EPVGACARGEFAAAQAALCLRRRPRWPAARLRGEGRDRRRRHCRVDCGGFHPCEGDPRPADAESGARAPGLRLRAAQGLRHRRPRQGAGKTRALRASSPFFRADHCRLRSRHRHLRKLMHASHLPPGPLSASLFVEGLRARAGFLVASALIFHALLWTLVAIISEPTPDPKIAAGLAIGREWMLGYPGLPILAPWVTEAVYSVFPSVLLMKALGSAAVALAGWYVFGLARRIVGEQHGALATLAMVGVTPVSFPVGALDSATIQMPIVAGMVLSWW